LSALTLERFILRFCGDGNLRFSTTSRLPRPCVRGPRGSLITATAALDEVMALVRTAYDQAVS
jgi:hypothetical protein